MRPIFKLMALAFVFVTAQPAHAQGWETLFDATDLSNFNTLGEAEWNIVDDYVESDGYTGSYLVSKEEYGDFELELEFWPSVDANSGVYVRNSNADKIAANAGYEINIFDTNENPDNRTGSIVFFSPPLVPVTTGGEWNKYQIKAEGSRIRVHLNGTLVADLDDETYASGPIAFQANGGLIRFRNIRIKPL